MIKLSSVFKNFHIPNNSVGNLLPWFEQITERLVINHDGSLLACFEFDGLDRYSSTKAEFDFATKIFENSIKILDERNSIWSIFEKRKSIVELKSQIANPVANFIETEWLKDLSRRNLSKFRNFIYISFLPSTPTDSSSLNWKNIIKNVKLKYNNNFNLYHLFGKKNYEANNFTIIIIIILFFL